MIAALLARYWLHIAGAVFLVGGIWYVHHHGYKSGQAEREAYYKPILSAAQSLASIAEARLKAQERESAELIKTQEKRRAETESTLKARAITAERSYARIVHDIARRRTCDMPGAAPSAAEPADAAAITERLGGVATRLRGVGERARADAERYAECQDFYNAQRAIGAR